jgi:hypothetical protein
MDDLDRYVESEMTKALDRASAERGALTANEVEVVLQGAFERVFGAPMLKQLACALSARFGIPTDQMLELIQREYSQSFRAPVPLILDR